MRGDIRGAIVSHALARSALIIRADCMRYTLYLCLPKCSPSLWGSVECVHTYSYLSGQPAMHMKASPMTCTLYTPFCLHSRSYSLCEWMEEGGGREGGLSGG